MNLAIRHLRTSHYVKRNFFCCIEKTLINPQNGHLWNILECFVLITIVVNWQNYYDL